MNYYISKFRFKLAFACIAGMVIICINGFKINMSFVEILRNYGVAFAVLVALSMYLWYPAFKYARSDPKELWRKWGSLAETKKREEFADFRFDCIYKKTYYAIAKEPNKGYRTLTTLESCTCSEFRKKHSPCKHMYKLADILGLYNDI